MIAFVDRDNFSIISKLDPHWNSRLYLLVIVISLNLPFFQALKTVMFCERVNTGSGIVSCTAVSFSQVMEYV